MKKRAISSILSLAFAVSACGFTAFAAERTVTSDFERIKSADNISVERIDFEQEAQS